MTDSLFTAWNERRESLAMSQGDEELFEESRVAIGDYDRFASTDDFVLSWLHENVLTDYTIGSQRLDRVTNYIDIDGLWKSEFDYLFAVDYDNWTYVFYRH